MVNESTTGKNVFVYTDKSIKYNVGDILSIDARIIGNTEGTNGLGIILDTEHFMQKIFQNPIMLQFIVPH